MKHVAGVGKIRKEGGPGQSTTRLLTREQGLTSKAAQHDAELGSREPKEGGQVSLRLLKTGWSAPRDSG